MIHEVQLLTAWVAGAVIWTILHRWSRNWLAWSQKESFVSQLVSNAWVGLAFIDRLKAPSLSPASESAPAHTRLEQSACIVSSHKGAHVAHSNNLVSACSTPGDFHALSRLAIYHRQALLLATKKSEA